MKLYRKVDINTGLFIEDVFSESQEKDMLDVTPAQGFYWPKWDGEKWIEGGTAPEPSTEPTAEEIAEAETKVLITETLIELGVLV